MEELLKEFQIFRESNLQQLRSKKLTEKTWKKRGFILLLEKSH